MPGVFDTFTIYAETLPPALGGPRVTTHPVLGPLTDSAWHHEGAPVCDLRQDRCPADAYVERIFPSSRTWNVLESRRPANDAASNDREWAAFMAGLESLLARSPRWIVLVESDCDQSEINQGVSTVDDLLARIDQHRRDGGSLAILRSSFGVRG